MIFLLSEWGYVETKDGKSLMVSILDMRDEKETIRIEKNQQIATVPYIGKEFVVFFELFLLKFPTVDYESVIHLTVGGNADKFGDRIPAVWITKAKTLYVATVINENRNKVFELSGLRLKSWNNVTIKQMLNTNGKVSLVSSTQC